MTNGEAINWIINISADIGKAEHRDLWHYEQALSEIRDMLESAQPEQQWIPCAVRMPEEDNRMSAESRQYSDHVLMSVYNADDDEAFIDYGYTVDGNWQSDTTDCLVPPWWEVIAWMPLPEPYKEDEQG